MSPTTQALLNTGAHLAAVCFLLSFAGLFWLGAKWKAQREAKR